LAKAVISLDSNFIRTNAHFSVSARKSTDDTNINHKRLLFIWNVETDLDRPNIENVIENSIELSLVAPKTPQKITLNLTVIDKETGSNDKTSEVITFIPDK
jgi:hypothetical protein